MKRWLRLALQLLSLVLFVFILWWAGPETWQVVATGDWQALLICFLLLGLAGICSTSRLRLVAQTVSQRPLPSWRWFFYLNWTTRALGVVLPRGISILGGKTVTLRAFGLPLQQAVWVVLLDNLYDVLVLGSVTIPAFLYLQRGLSWPLFGLFSLVGMGVVTAVLGWGLGRGQIRPFLGWLQRFPWLAQRLNLETPWLPSPSQLLAILAWSIPLHLTLIFTFYYIGQAVGLTTPPVFYAASYPFTQLSLIIAIAPGGLGIFDLGWLGLLRLEGVSQEQALAFVVAQRAYISIFVVLWAVVSVLLSLTAEPRPQIQNGEL